MRVLLSYVLSGDTNAVHTVIAGASSAADLDGIAGSQNESSL
jgi:hypothetical protein